MKFIILHSIAGIIVLLAQTSTAADMYRCGNAFQDTPCITSNSKTTKDAVKATSAKQQNNHLSPFNIDADCKQRGDAAKKIMWLREVGKTQAQQLEGAQDSQTKTLIKDVYSHNGSSLEVRNAIEQECMQQKEQDKLAEKLLIESNRLKGTTTLVSENSADGKIEAVNAKSRENIDATAAQNELNRKKSECASLRSAAEQYYLQRRRGGSAEHMNQLKKSLESTEAAIKANGC